MLNAELAKKPAALCFAALDSKAAGPILQKFQDAKIRSSPLTPASIAPSR